MLWYLSLGPEPTLFGKPKYSCMRLHYKSGEVSGYFHTLRAVTRNPEDDGKGTRPWNIVPFFLLLLLLLGFFWMMLQNSLAVM